MVLNDVMIYGASVKGTGASDRAAKLYRAKNLAFLEE
jgi:hypothetical protein